MQLSHRDDPSRTATLTHSDGELVAVVHHTDAQGKLRKKSFRKKTPWQAREAAVRFLLNTEGYILRSPQDGPIEWMARLMLDGYRGEIAHAVDRITGVVWVHDAEDQVHRIVPGSCATSTVRLGSGNESPGASIVAVGGDEAWCLAPDWDRTAEGLVRHYRIYRVHGREELRAEQVADLVGPELIGQLGTTRDGHVLGPAEGGAALYGEDGVVQRIPCTPGEGTTGQGRPTATVSADGTWVVSSHVDHMLREHRPSGERTRLRADGFKGFDGVQITDDGHVYAAGFRYPSHGLWRLSEDEPRRVSEDTRATVRADGRRLVEVRYGGVTVCDPQRPSDDEMKLAHVIAELHLPVLGMAKYGRAAFGPDDTLAVLTDAYTVASISLRTPP